MLIHLLWWTTDFNLTQQKCTCNIVNWLKLYYYLWPRSFIIISLHQHRFFWRIRQFILRQSLSSFKPTASKHSIKRPFDSDIIAAVGCLIKFKIAWIMQYSCEAFYQCVVVFVCYHGTLAKFTISNIEMGYVVA